MENTGNEVAMENHLCNAENAVSRREFVNLALMSSAVLMGASQVAEGAVTEPAVRSYAARCCAPRGMAAHLHAKRS